MNMKTIMTLKTKKWILYDQSGLVSSIIAKCFSSKWNKRHRDSPRSASRYIKYWWTYMNLFKWMCMPLYIFISCLIITLRPPVCRPCMADLNHVHLSHVLESFNAFEALQPPESDQPAMSSITRYPLTYSESGTPNPILFVTRRERLTVNGNRHGSLPARIVSKGPIQRQGPM